MVIDTGAGEKGYNSLVKPKPMRLSLEPHHAAYLGPISFSPARFSTGSGEESSIVTSTGAYVIRWNFRRVKLGKKFDYVIKRYNDEIVTDSFRFGSDRDIVVVGKGDVGMVAKMDTPAKFLKKIAVKEY
jgi:hypothetical protein